MGTCCSGHKRVKNFQGVTESNSRVQERHNAIGSDTPSNVGTRPNPRKSQHTVDVLPSDASIPGLISKNEPDIVEQFKPDENKRPQLNVPSTTKTTDRPSEEFCQNAMLRELHKEIKELRDKELAFEDQIAEYDKEIKRLKAEKNTSFPSKSGKAQNIDEKEREIVRLKEVNEELQLRLSRIASDHLTDNNPDITDLSDQNRSVKLAEQYGEIYCNEWTAAFDSLTERLKKSHRESIKILLELLKATNDACKARAKEQLKVLTKNVTEFIGTNELPHNITVTLKALKDAKKRNYKLTLLNLQDEINIRLKTVTGLDVLEDFDIMKYVKSVTDTCWLMNISDPPLVLKTKCKPGTQFDKNYFVEYMSPGDTVDFLVWPALLLCKDGAILRKGIAEPKRQHNDNEDQK